MLSLLVFSLIYLIIPASSALQPFIWPLPTQYTISNELTINVNGSTFQFIQNTHSDIITSAFARYNTLCFPHQSEGNGDSKMNTILGLNVSIKKASETLQATMDESYTITISDTADFAQLQSNTIWGALRGLETFSQMIIFNSSLRNYQTYTGFISDFPRFPHRGVMIDTSRHFVPIKILTNLLDAMSYSKFNVLHIHMTDANSFPFQSVSYSNLQKEGSYSPNEIYFQNDIKYLINYALYRGIRVIPEFDIPGHAASWCKGYPDICPSPKCNTPLNPASNVTWQLLTGLIAEVADLFIDNHIHLGGDEVNTQCLTETESIVEWMNMMNFTAMDAINYFDQNAIEIAYNNNQTVINWDDVYRNFAPNLDPNKVIIQYYTASNHTLFPDIVNSGFRGVYSPDPVWYLPHTTVTWQKRYLTEPTVNVNESMEKYVIGGEGCLWTAHYDASDVQAAIWPAAAAIGERLWSQKNVTSTTNALPRIEYFRCLLNERGIVASPVNQEDGTAPTGPGSCYLQRRRI